MCLLLTPEPYQVAMQAIVTECTNAFLSTIISAPASYSDPDLLCGVDWIFHTSTNDIFPYITPINDVAPISASIPARAIGPTSGGTPSTSDQPIFGQSKYVDAPIPLTPRNIHQQDNRGGPEDR